MLLSPWVRELFDAFKTDEGREILRGAFPELARGGGGSKDPDELLTVAEAATVLHCSEDAIYKKIRRGHLPARRTGRSIRVRRGDL